MNASIAKHFPTLDGTEGYYVRLEDKFGKYSYAGPFQKHIAYRLNCLVRWHNAMMDLQRGLGVEFYEGDEINHVHQIPLSKVKLGCKPNRGTLDFLASDFPE